MKRDWRRPELLSVVGPAVALTLFGCSGDLGSARGDMEDMVVGTGDIHIVGTSELLVRIEDLLPATDGTAWVINSTEPFLVLFSAAGEVLRAEGVSGGGPGEFSWPTTLVEDPTAESVWVYDASLGKLTRIADDLRATETLALAGSTTAGVRLNSYEYLWTNNGGRTWIDRSGGKFVYARPTPGLPWISSFWSTEVVRLTKNGNAETVFSTADIVGDPTGRFGEARRFLPYPIWAACEDGSLAMYDPNANLLRRFGESGDPMRVHTLPPERGVPMSAERVIATVFPGVLRNRLMVNLPDEDVLRELFRRDYENRAAEFAAEFPEYVHFDCAPDNTLWLQLFDSSQGQMGRGPSWIRVTESGETGRVDFPTTFRPMRFRGERVWGIHTGDLDVEYVAWTDAVGL